MTTCDFLGCSPGGASEGGCGCDAGAGDRPAADIAAARLALAEVDELLARPAAIVWTRNRASMLPLAHIQEMGPEFVAALTAALTALAALLRQERDRRLRREGHRRTRQDDQ